MSSESFTLAETARPGRVALRAGSLARVVPFYREVVGLEATREGNQVQLSADGSVLLELHEAPDAMEREPTEAGLFHVAFRYPDRDALATRLERVRESEYDLTGASDHNVSEALYLRDPERNGVELYCDRPRSEWPHTAEGGVDIDTLPLDLADLARANGNRRDERTGKETKTGPETRGAFEIGDGRDDAHAPAGTTIGHVHLETTDLASTEAFYTDGLGLTVRARYGNEAAFFAAGEYHHHVGVNTWNERTESAGSGRGLAWFEFVLPDTETLDTVAARFENRGDTVERQGDRAFVHGPDGIELRLGTA